MTKCLYCRELVQWDEHRAAWALVEGTGSIMCASRGRDPIGRPQLHAPESDRPTS